MKCYLKDSITAYYYSFINTLSNLINADFLCSNINFLANYNTSTLLLRRSKTDTTNHGVQIVLARIGGITCCAGYQNILGLEHPNSLSCLKLLEVQWRRLGQPQWRLPQLASLRTQLSPMRSGEVEG